jgi:hypothetical protein
MAHMRTHTASAHAGRTDSGGEAGETSTYVRASVSEVVAGRADRRIPPPGYLGRTVIPEGCSHRDGGLHGHQDLPGHDHEASHG